MSTWDFHDNFRCFLDRLVDMVADGRVSSTDANSLIGELVDTDIDKPQTAMQEAAFEAMDKISAMEFSASNNLKR